MAQDRATTGITMNRDRRTRFIVSPWSNRDILIPSPLLEQVKKEFGEVTLDNVLSWMMQRENERLINEGVEIEPRTGAW